MRFVEFQVVRSKKTTAVVFILALAAVGLLQACSFQSDPDTKDIVEQFRANKVVYEQLRDHLEADYKLREVADWGYRTFESPLVLQAPTPDLSIIRYQEYLSLLARVKAKVAWRSEGTNPTVCVAVWSTGWAADTQHVSICSFRIAPTHIAATDSKKALDNNSSSFVHIDENWYLSRDVTASSR